MKNVLAAQSGGPSAAVNATLAGVFERATTSRDVGAVLGALYGIKGLIDGGIVDVGVKLSNPDTLKQLIYTPSAALGSCRLKLPEPEDNPDIYETIFKNFKKHNIGWFVYIGGNDSMDTVAKLSRYAKTNGITDVCVMGAPKTIDNDLCEMDHSPGFGSAARYVATTFSELWCDCRVYDIPAVTIVEVMGRNVGWLTAASSLAGFTGDAPHLIYLQEIPFNAEHFVADVREKLAESKAVVVAVSEGIKDLDGRYVGDAATGDATDVFGHKYLSGAARTLENIVRGEIGCKARSIDLSLMQRCAGHLASSNDLTESKLLGVTALDRALYGVSGEVSVIKRVSDDPYRVTYETVPVEKIANRERSVPREWINERGNYVTDAMLTYLTPLIEGKFGSQYNHGLPVHTRLY